MKMREERYETKYWYVKRCDDFAKRLVNAVAMDIGAYGMWLLECAAILLLLIASPALANDQRPNVLLIVADDLGYHDVGYQGSEIRTPAIDRLAAEGVRMDAGYVAASVCSPSRAGMMTGRSPARFGYRDNPPQSTAPNIGLPLTETTIADVMRRAGYFTAAVGKWHLGLNPIFHPRNRGFDHFFGFLGGQHNYFSALADPLERNGVPVTSVPGGYTTFAFGDEAIKLMDEHQDGPLFIYLAFNAPHSPMQAPAEYVNRYRSITDPTRRTYAAMVSAMDDTIDRVVARTRALSRPTLVIFLSDNGGVPKWGGENAPLRGNKGSVFEGGVRVPMIWHMPGSLQAGRFPAPVSSIDIMPTIAALAGVSQDEASRLDGVNVWPALTGQEAARDRTLYWKMDGPAAIRDGRWKLTKLDGGATSLFDIGASPLERPNILAANPSRAAELRTELADWISTLDPPLW